MTVRLHCIAIDSTDPERLGRWWAEALGWEAWGEPDGYCVVAPPGRGHARLEFLQVPEPKSGKNRLHLDLTPDDQAEELARFVRLGAVPVDIGQEGDPDVNWVVLADPEGNEFCVGPFG
jgi:catechol 2,3-dioxygenase-like lactoylglutathione lyase family enzyme